MGLHSIIRRSIEVVGYGTRLGKSQAIGSNGISAGLKYVSCVVLCSRSRISLCVEGTGFLFVTGSNLQVRMNWFR